MDYQCTGGTGGATIRNLQGCIEEFEGFKEFESLYCRVEQILCRRMRSQTGGGRGGIRTLEAVLPPTRFPVARTRPGYATLPNRLSAIGFRPLVSSCPDRLTDSPTHRLRAGGEGGIRTHGGSSPHRFSRAAPSTTRTPLQPVKYTNAVPGNGIKTALVQQNRPVVTGRRLGGTPGRIRTCGLWVRNPTLYPLSYRRASIILHHSGCHPPWRIIWGGKGGIRTLGALFQRSTA